MQAIQGPGRVKGSGRIGFEGLGLRVSGSGFIGCWDASWVLQRLYRGCCRADPTKRDSSETLILGACAFEISLHLQ